MSEEGGKQIKETTILWIAVVALAVFVAANALDIRGNELIDLARHRTHNRSHLTAAKVRDAPPRGADDIRRYGYNDGLGDALAEAWCARTVEDRSAHKSLNPATRALELQWEHNAWVEFSE